MTQLVFLVFGSLGSQILTNIGVQKAHFTGLLAFVLEKCKLTSIQTLIIRVYRVGSNFRNHHLKLNSLSNFSVTMVIRPIDIFVGLAMDSSCFWLHRFYISMFLFEYQPQKPQLELSSFLSKIYPNYVQLQNYSGQFSQNRVLIPIH